jgi:hypothetical protein
MAQSATRSFAARNGSRPAAAAPALESSAVFGAAAGSLMTINTGPAGKE